MVICILIVSDKGILHNKIPVPSMGPALGYCVKEGWDRLFIFLQDALLK